jgi:hypothetical protein
MQIDFPEWFSVYINHFLSEARTTKGKIRAGTAYKIKAYAASEYATRKKQKHETLANRVMRIRETLKAHPEYAQSFEVMPFNSGYFM